MFLRHGLWSRAASSVVFLLLSLTIVAPENPHDKKNATAMDALVEIDNEQGWPNWPGDFLYYIGEDWNRRSNHKCIRIIERNQYHDWMGHSFCWLIMRKKTLKIVWSDKWKESGMRCTQITEPRERKDSGWDNNYLCVQQDAPYRFQWSSNGTIDGLYCLKWMGKERMDGWDNNYLCADRYPEIKYTSWSPWQPCSKTCGEGTQSRLRHCKMGRVCNERLNETRVCRKKKCPEVAYTSWSPWQPCNRICGGGIESRVRQCKHARNCGERLLQTRPCNSHGCPGWPNWPGDFSFYIGVDWGKRSNHKCIRIIEGQQYLDWMGHSFCWSIMREKTLKIVWSDKGQESGMRCTHITEPREKKESDWHNNYLCVQRDAPYRFQWSSNGRIKGLHCIKWRLKNGRDGWNNNYLCADEYYETPVNTYSPWSAWQPCSKTCGNGTQSRQRHCEEGGMCLERLEETRACNIHPCLGWPNWPGDFSFYIGVDWNKRFNHKCIRIIERNQYLDWMGHSFCWSIMRKKTLKIVWSDKGQESGMRCTQITEPREKKASDWHNNYLCVQRDAPYRFQWSSNGRIKGLHCIKWRLKNGRDGWNNNYLCADEYYETPGSYYTQWSPWQSCSKTCGVGSQIRSRKCYTEMCNERLEETRACNSRSCPTSTYSPWSAWQPCSKTCGNGVQNRQRHCEGGGMCLERLEETRSCNIHPCLVCPNKWITWKTKNSHFCYRLVYDALTWPKAQTACEKRNANLLSLESQEEFQFVKDNVQDRRSVWIGANDRKTEGVWQWTDGTNFTFAKLWGSGEPNNSNNNEDCAMMSHGGRWNDYPCAHKFYYICKKVPH